MIPKDPNYIKYSPCVIFAQNNLESVFDRWLAAVRHVFVVPLPASTTSLLTPDENVSSHFSAANFIS